MNRNGVGIFFVDIPNIRMCIEWTYFCRGVVEENRTTTSVVETISANVGKLSPQVRRFITRNVFSPRTSRLDSMDGKDSKSIVSTSTFHVS